MEPTAEVSEIPRRSAFESRLLPNGHIGTTAIVRDLGAVLPLVTI
jgi:hypothetical protein